jgi:hypothetical protein
MNSNRNNSVRAAQRRRPQSALERLDAFLERNKPSSTSEMVNRLRLALFGVLAGEPEEPAEIKPPA